MSNSTTSVKNPHQEKARVPRAVIHKKILDAAESRPDASIEAIAEDVNGATTQMVERVLEEYGDPATPSGESEGGEEEDTDLTTSKTNSEPKNPDTEEITDDNEAETDCRLEDGNEETADSEPDTGIEMPAEKGEEDGGDQRSETMEPVRNGHESQATSSLTASELTEKQLETLREIYRRPSATQAELGDTLGVTSATINQRVNTIAGFDWTNRQHIVGELFENEATNDDETTEADRSVDSDSDARCDSSIESSKNADTSSESVNSREEQPKAESDAVRSRASSTEGSTRDREHEREDHVLTGTSSRVTADSLEELEELETRITVLADQVEMLTDRSAEHSLSSLSPELIHKIVHACLTAEHISQEEELRILRSLVATGSE
ncbi:MarR family transcriptional regulator [Natronococcus occultus]|nr:helix-turn-helix domain-containing protein [Natronococcus occultus]